MKHLKIIKQFSFKIKSRKTLFDIKNIYKFISNDYFLNNLHKFLFTPKLNNFSHSINNRFNLFYNFDKKFTKYENEFDIFQESDTDFKI